MPCGPWRSCSFVGGLGGPWLPSLPLPALTGPGRLPPAVGGSQAHLAPPAPTCPLGVSELVRQHWQLAGEGLPRVAPAPALPGLSGGWSVGGHSRGPDTCSQPSCLLGPGRGLGNGHASPTELCGRARGRRCQDASLEPPAGEGAGEQFGAHDLGLVTSRVSPPLL